MAFRQAYRTLFRKAVPVVYATTVLTNSITAKKPCSDDKLALETPSVNNLSYDYMIKQSTIDAVNSASQVLTVTYAAIESTSKEYRYLLTKLIILLQETLAREVSDSHWDEIVEVRCDVQRKKQIVTQLIGFMDHVHKMASAASETTYLAGMDNLSSTLCERIENALRNMEEEVNSNQRLENEYRHIQQQCIVKSDRKDILEEASKEDKDLLGKMISLD